MRGIDSVKMMFKQKALAVQPTIGELLQSARVERKLTIEAVAVKIKISAKYLHALERGAYHDLPSIVYIQHYLKVYAQVLGIPWSQIEQQYQQEVHVYKNTANVHVQRRWRQRVAAIGAHQQRPLLIPRLLKMSLFGLVIFIIALYFMWEVVKFLSPPELVIYQPASDMIISEQTLIIAGKSAPEAIVEINGQAVSVKTDGTFEEKISLQRGLNTIRIVTKTKHSQQRVEVRHILYKPAAD